MADLTSGANNVQAIIETARRGADWEIVRLDAESSVVFVPKLGDGDFRSLEQYLPFPKRKSGAVTVFDAASFNIVVADNADAGSPSIYIDRDPISPGVVAVLNGHGKSGPGWSDLRVNLEFRKTPQWVRWNEIDGKMLPQVTFAEFIEDNLEDITDPTGATMLEIASYLQATQSSDFKSGVALSNGLVQFQNIETIDAKVGSSQIQVPTEFKLGIAPLFGVDRYSVPCRFRYRVKEGKLFLGFKLQRIEDLMGQVLDDILAKIERGTNISVLDGLPPTQRQR
jgi:uncharacterized protein YfdQ (DUF2303 family)